MEIDPFGRVSPESSSDDEADDDSSSKKKKKSKRSPLTGSSSEPAEKSDKASESSEEKQTDQEPLWRRILGQSAVEKESSEPAGDETEPESPEEGEEPETSLEELSPAEQLEVAEAYVAAREAELQSEKPGEADDAETAAARTADLALLQAMRQFLARERGGSETTVDEPIEQAYAATLAQLGYQDGEASAGARGGEQAMPAAPEIPEPSVPWRPERPIATEPEFAAPMVSEQKTVETVETGDLYTPTEMRRKTGSALLVGGLVGYAIGRRRGRIKSEKQFKTVEQKLTRQVETVKQQVAQKEEQIVRLARETAASKYLAETRPFSGEHVPKIEKKPLASSERLGLVTLKAVEAPRRVEARPAASAPEKPALKASPAEVTKPVNALPRNELLVAAAEINVGNTNLKRVYETNLISEQGLRRLVEEHERGGNVRESLEREIVEKEMSYERDPRLRGSSVVGSLAASNAVRADAGLAAPQAPAMADKAQAASGATDTSANAAGTPSSTARQPAAVAAAVTLVVVIAILLVILFTSR